MSQPSPAPVPPDVARRAATAGFLGSLIEAYDLYVYSYLVVFMAVLFFDSRDPATAILATLGVLGVGYVARPLGGLFFGRLGDRIGRRRTLVITVVGMGLATTALGLLPTYAQIGVLAPALMVVLRLVQGFSAGGELMGSATYVAEHSVAGNRGLLASITPMGVAFGTALAPGIVALTSILLAPAQMAAWGWRIPLLVSLPLTIVCLLYRKRLEDSPAFRAVAEQESTASTPMRELVGEHRPALFRVIGLAFAVLLAGSFSGAFMPTYLVTQAGIAPGTVAAISAVIAFLGAPLVMVAGRAVDRFGRRPTMALLFAAEAVVVLPVMIITRSVDSVVLVGAAWFAMGTLAGVVSAPAYAAFTGLFPTRVRYSGAALGFGVGTALGAGLGPYLAGQLTVSVGTYAPAILVVVAGVVGAVVTLTSPDTFAGADTDATDVADRAQHDARPDPQQLPT